MIEALRKIEAELRQLARDADEGDRINSYHLAVLARKVEAQVEMLERGLVG